MCEGCENFADGVDVIVRELTQEEKMEMSARLKNFEDNVVLTGEKLKRRKGVN